MLDGFNEVCPDYKVAATRLINVLKDTEVAQIYVTSRVHQKEHLERVLASLAYNLKPWNDECQVEFLHKFWKWSLKYKKDPFNGQSKEKSYEEIRKYLEHVRNSQKQNEHYKNELIESISVVLDKFPVKANCEIEQFGEAIDNELKFKKFIETFLKRWRYSINDRDMKFVSSPLHLRILSEMMIYKQFEMPTDQGLSCLYDEFVKIKFGQFR